MKDRVEYARVDMNGSRGRGHGLSPLELHGEAAVILSKIASLPTEEKACIHARHGDSAEGVRVLCRVVRIDAPQDFVELAVLNWAVSKPSVRQMARMAGVSYRKAYSWKSEVSRSCRDTYNRALNSLESVLFQPGGYDKS